MSESKAIVRFVSPTTLRERFNSSQLPAAIAQGDLIPKLSRDARLKAPQLINEPEGTRAQYIHYYDAEGTWVVDVFQYLRPDGTIGASGKPDPKRMRVGDEIWVVGPA